MAEIREFESVVTDEEMRTWLEAKGLTSQVERLCDELASECRQSFEGHIGAGRAGESAALIPEMVRQAVLIGHSIAALERDRERIRNRLRENLTAVGPRMDGSSKRRYSAVIDRITRLMRVPLGRR